MQAKLNRTIFSQTLNLPESDEVQIPAITVGTGIETGEQSVGWSTCDGAVGYELEEQNSGTWQLIYVGTATGYGLGTLPLGIERTFRVRAVYGQVVSLWSNSVSAP